MSAPETAGTARKPIGAALIHPLSLACLVVLVVNDHYLKKNHPGVLSGKLSDFAAVLLLPLVLAAFGDLATRMTAGRLPSVRARNAWLSFSALVAAVVLALPEVWPLAEAAYRHGFSILQWPFRAIATLVTEERLPGLRPVQATADVTDLVALPMALVATWLGWERTSEPKNERSRHRASTLAAMSVFALLQQPTPARAAETPPPAPASAPSSAPSPTADQIPKPAKPPGDFSHNGFYLDLELGGGLLIVSSQGSMTNGFRQRLPSSARGPLFPSATFSIGGTLPALPLVIALRTTRGESVEPAISTLDQTFSIPTFRLELLQVGLLAKYYFDREKGFHVGGALSFMMLETAMSTEMLAEANLQGGQGQAGGSFALESGYAFWLHRLISLGVVGRVTAGRLTGRSGGTTVVAPEILAALVFN